MKEQKWCELKVESSLKNLEVIGDFIAETMHNFGIEDIKDIFDVQLSVDEACTNVIEHAYSGKEDGLIWVKCGLSESKKEFIVKIIDSGKPFNPNAVQTPNTEAKLDEQKRGGFGIFIMKQKMQSIKYAFSDKGNELTMIKLLH